jgi:hypothetical protein
MFISLLAQRNEPKKVQPFTWPSASLRCSQRTGDIGKSLTLRRVAYPFFTVLLGGVKWHQDIFFNEQNKRFFRKFVKWKDCILGCRLV